VSGIRELYHRFRQLIHEGAKFLVVGAIGTVVTFGVAIPLHGIGEYKSVTIATIVATVVTYLGNRYWSFRHRQSNGTARDSVLFFVMNGIGLLIYYACIWLIRGVLHLGGPPHSQTASAHLWYTVALVLGTGLGTLFRFWSYRKWVWPAAPPPLGARIGHGQPGQVPGSPEYESLSPLPTGTSHLTPGGSDAPYRNGHLSSGNGHLTAGDGRAASGGRHAGAHRRR
jgi:putative flippase GtrA